MGAEGYSVQTIALNPCHPGRDQIYRNAALGHREWAGLMSVTILTAGMLGLTLGVTASYIYPRRQFVARATDPAKRQRRLTVILCVGVAVLSVQLI